MSDAAAHVAGTEAVRTRAAGLYTFLKEFTELRSKIIRSVEQYDHVLWFSDVPREPECDCAAWHRGRDRDGGEVWLEIRQPSFVSAPTPPAQLEPWLVHGQVSDSSIEMPELRDEISVTVRNESGEERLERRLIADHPDIRSSWETYVEAQWWPWAEADRRVQSVQRVYTQLFSIFQKQQRLGEQYEVVIGLGLLSWRTPDDQEVRRHLLVAHTNIAFDSSRGVITIGPAGEGANAQIEQDMLDPRLRPDPNELCALEGQVADLGDRVWDPAPIDAILAGWVHSASPRGVYRDHLLTPPERAQADPEVHLAPALILRRRTERSFLKAFEEIIAQIKAGMPIPPGVGRFVTVTEDPGGVALEEDAATASGDRRSSEIYFPLESNEAQRRIIDRLASHQGVLVQGPPGTGKSHTIVNLICHLLASGQRVLVTSHTARALRVLQRYIRGRTPEISPLAVVLLGDDRDALQAMEDSVQGITFRHNLWDSHTNARKIRELESQLDDARREESKVLADLRSIRESETHPHHPRPGGYAGTLQAIATRLRKEEDAFDWIEDRPRENQEPPLPTDQFQDLLSMLRDADIDRWESEGHRALNPSFLASPDTISALVDRERRAKAAYEEVAEAQRRPAYAPLATASAEARKRVIEELGALLDVVDRVRRHLHAWAESAVLEVLGDHDRGWRELLDVTKEHLSCIADRARWADETAISWLVERDRHEVRADAEALLTHFEAGGGWGIGPFRAGPAKRGRYLRREVKVGGRPCHTPEVLKDLITWLDVENRLRLLRERWTPFHRIVSRSFSSQVRDLEDLCEPLEAALGLHARVARIRTMVQAIPSFPEPTWHDLSALQMLLDSAKALENEDRFREAEAALTQARDESASQVHSPGADPAGRDLLAALEVLDADAYRDAFSRVSENHARATRLEQREGLLSKLRESAPLLAEQLPATARHESWDTRATQFEAAWNWARVTAWLERLSDPEAEQQLRLRLDSARDRIRRRLKEIAAEKAWAHCFERMTEHERQHLVAWSKAVRSIGKGTGKYAPMHRRSAREHMNECRSAIPAWVMPLYRVAETIKPGSDLFDVVIIDEASQSGPEALLLAYLAKKLVVVGDDKQISPTYAGINHEDVNQLRARHLMDLPHSDAYGVQQSFFDLAEIRYQGRIRLREHFRCMPEIIQFSNNLCYASEPLIPLRQYGGSRLSPVISARHVREGYLKGIGQSVSNPPEAQALVAEILRMHEDPAYEGKTFGVISLLGEVQAREIEALLLEKLGPNAMEGRQLVCGDAYAFQGDERDVMLLSLVSAPSQGRRIGTLTDEAARRRFNVAASRARDQLLLFHTASLNDLSPQCLRYALLQYCQNPRVDRQEVAGVPLAELRHVAATADRDRVRPPEPFQSWFELDVFLQVVARGYRVLPQYEVAGYRIDLVVEGMRRRIAVECDGDRWHGPDQYENDMTRQRILERCGWRFWRVRGSAYALDPNGALEELWETLQREKVYPEGCEPQAEPLGADARRVLAPHDGEVGQVTAETPTAEVGPSDSAPPHQGVEKTEVSRSQELKTAAPLDLGVRGEVVALADPPYRAWIAATRLPDPTEALPSELIPGLLQIVAIEGPMSAERLYRIFVKGAGRQRVGRQSRSALNKALWRALREGLLEERNETGRSGLKERVLRKAGSPPVLVRPRGDREFVEIPPSEIATVMLRLTRQNPTLRGRELYRVVLDFFEIRRLTPNIEQRLRWIEERRDQLTAST